MKIIALFSSSINYWFIFLAFTVVLFFFLVIVLLIWVNKINNTINSLKKDNNYLKSKISKTESQTVKINSTPEMNKISNSTIQTEVFKENEQLIEEEKSLPIEMEDITVPKTVEDIFYMPSPSSDGDFEISNRSNIFKETISLYKFFVHDDNPNKADFEFHSDSIGIKNAVNYPDRYLEPVCLINSAYNPNTKEIVTEKKGVAEIVADKWVVNHSNKAHIKYE